MNTIVDVVVERPSRTKIQKEPNRELKSKPSLFMLIKNRYIKRSMSKVWGQRNSIHGDVFIDTLELESITFQQHIFIEETKSITDKLYRLDFIEQSVFPDIEMYQDFCKTFYNKKHNLAIYLFSPNVTHHISAAKLISNNTTMDMDMGLCIFLNTINTLISK